MLTAMRPYDAMLDTAGDPRPPLPAVLPLAVRAAPEHLIRKRTEADALFHRVGITFAVYGENQGTCGSPSTSSRASCQPPSGHQDSVTPQGVTRMLPMRDDLPQGVHRCLDELQANLAAVANDQSSETLRRVGELHAQVRFGRFEELCAGGVGAFLDRFQQRLRDLGRRIADDFLVPSSTY